jgi:hypothetical protein
MVGLLVQAGAVFDAVWNLRKPMDLAVWLGANHSDALLHREELQRRQAAKDAVSCSTPCRTLHHEQMSFDSSCEDFNAQQPWQERY